MTPSTTVYFDPTDATNCLPLLPVDLQSAVELVRIASDCEADILNTFTKPINRVQYFGYPSPATLPVILQTSVYTDLGNGLAVYLAGYTTDPTQCTDTHFVMAMRRTVARLIEWRWTQSQRDVQVKQATGTAGSLAGGQKTWINYDALPPAWDRYLKPYDTRETAWGI